MNKPFRTPDAWDRRLAAARRANRDEQFLAFVDMLCKGPKAKHKVDTRSDHQRDFDNYQVEVGDKSL